MIAFSDRKFTNNEEADRVAIKIMNECFKSILIVYVKEDPEIVFNTISFSNSQKAKFINIKALKKVIPISFRKSIKQLGIDVDIFLSRKLAQIVETVFDESEETVLDIINEYIVVNIIKSSFKLVSFGPYPINDIEKAVIKKALKEKHKERNDFLYDEGFEEYKIMQEIDTALNRDLHCLLNVDTYAEPIEDDEMLFLWDFDFEFFDEWGVSKTLQSLVFGSLVSRGYGYIYTKEIFLSVEMPVPSIVEKDMWEMVKPHTESLYRDLTDQIQMTNNQRYQEHLSNLLNL